jgi:hypothetical protein
VPYREKLPNSVEETPPFISEGHNTARRSWVKTYPLWPRLH